MCCFCSVHGAFWRLSTTGRNLITETTPTEGGRVQHPPIGSGVCHSRGSARPWPPWPPWPPSPPPPGVPRLRRRGPHRIALKLLATIPVSSEPPCLPTETSRAIGRLPGHPPDHAPPKPTLQVIHSLPGRRSAGFRSQTWPNWLPSIQAPAKSPPIPMKSRHARGWAILWEWPRPLFGAGVGGSQPLPLPSTRAHRAICFFGEGTASSAAAIKDSISSPRRPCAQ
jgi:hypothetical protein